MPIPFPGMNPYLEHPDLWPEVHQKLILALADTLQHQLPEHYQVRLQKRHYQVSGEDSLVVGSPGLNWKRDGKASPAENPALANLSTSNLSAGTAAADTSPTSPSPTGKIAPPTPPHSSPYSSDPSHHSTNEPIPVLVPVPQKIHETYLEIVNAHGELITLIEALSPKKKRPGRGRTLYERQRETIFGSPIHFVEIDLLRGWEPPSIYGPDEFGDYRILISRSEQRPRAQLHIWNVMEPIPTITLPLSGHEELLLPLKPVIDQACDRIDLLVNYQQNPLPPLRDAESLWLEDFLQQVGMRPVQIRSGPQACSSAQPNRLTLKAL